MEITWVKLKTKMFDDEKIQLIESMPEADAILVIWIKLLIQAGKTNANGYIMLSQDIPYSPEMLSTIFRRPLQIIKFALKTLVDLGMIEVTESHAICISNWEKHQNIDGLEKVREQNRIRKQKERERKLLLQAENKDLSRDMSRDVTQQIKINIKNKIKNKEEEEKLLQCNNNIEKCNIALEEEKEEISLAFSSWNNFAETSGLKKIIKLTELRKTGIKQRLKEKEFDLNLIFEKIKQSKFLLGDNNRNWKVDFDFIFCSKNKYLKILEGKYDDGTNKKSDGNNHEYVEPDFSKSKFAYNRIRNNDGTERTI